ncbi:hypothetical protein TVAG_057320 [Trichomonas vaginalis G3]|uniref:Uncharacterized protein n=1 Tax=Trichomonas vaginalis (strain ATCC PRA-98 / G3) TaxID=412133 RepID=A2F8L0_TRIV3|nr:hypothetical protein TVAGG3_0084640 [Trichomonas vaginalis G3]EAX98742.1 hypothetical protein TVAG_057320 [Trichomonas vaginalis G3]KAI5543508.1 hypothetical protein TVAGG3_0084640 [Trichomonas vaginalis G3]|eukprot:XP_001311672.1 hypothetical protein [Trichomonas vaginalis G3]
MIAFFLLRSSVAITWCNDEDVIEIRPGMIETRTILSNHRLCISGSVVIKSDKPFEAEYQEYNRYSDAYKDLSLEKEGKRQNIFVLGSYYFDVKMSIKAVNELEDIQISVMGVTPSFENDPKASDGYSESFGVFTSFKSFDCTVTLPSISRLIVTAINQVPLKFTVKHPDDVELRINANGQEDATTGNNVRLILYNKGETIQHP